jgi:hypothetical protein
MAVCYYFFSDRGFDMIDDGANMLHYSFPNYYQKTLHIYHKLTTGLLGIDSLQPAFLRKLNLLIFSVSGIFISLSCYLLINRPGISRFASVSSMVMSGVLLSSEDRMLNYNSINLLITSLLMFILVTVSVRKEIKFHYCFGLIFLAGLLSGFQLHLKFSTGILLLTISVGILFLYQPLKRIVIYLTGLMVSFLWICIWFFSTPLIWWERFYENYNLTRFEGYGSQEHLLSFFGTILIDSLLLFLSYHLIKFLYTIFGRNKVGRSGRLMILFLAWLAMTLLTNHITTIQSDFRSGIHVFYKLIALLPLVNVYLIYQSLNRQQSLPVLLFSVLFFIMPFLIETGGMSNPYLALGSYAGFWMGSISLCLAQMYRPHKISKPLLFLLNAAVIMIFLHNHFFYPLRLITGLNQQSIVSVHGLKLDPQTSVYLNKWNIILKNIENKSKRPIANLLFLYNEAGTVYLLNKKSPVIPVYLSLGNDPKDGLEQYSTAYNQMIIERFRPDTCNATLIACRKSLANSKIWNKLVGHRILVDSLYSPYQAECDSCGGANVYVYY